MKYTELRLAAGKTINLGNFNMLRIDADLTVSLAEGDDVGATCAIMQREMRALLAATYRHQLKSASAEDATPPPADFVPARPL